MKNVQNVAKTQETEGAASIVILGAGEWGNQKVNPVELLQAMSAIHSKSEVRRVLLSLNMLAEYMGGWREVGEMVKVGNLSIDVMTDARAMANAKVVNAITKASGGDCQHRTRDILVEHAKVLFKKSSSWLRKLGYAS